MDFAIEKSDTEITLDITPLNIKLVFRKDGGSFVYDYDNDNLFSKNIEPFNIYKNGNYLTTIFTMEDFFTEWGYVIFREVKNAYLVFKVEKNIYPKIKKILGKMGFNEISDSPSFLYIGFDGIVKSEEDDENEEDDEKITYYLPIQELATINELLTHKREYGHFFTTHPNTYENEIVLMVKKDGDSVKTFNLVNEDPCWLEEFTKEQYDDTGLISWHTHPQDCDGTTTNFGSLFSIEDIFSYFEKSTICDFVFANEGIYVADKKKIFYKLLASPYSEVVRQILIRNFENFYSFNHSKITKGMECISVIYGLGKNYGKAYHTNTIYASTLLLFFLQNETLLNSLYFLFNPMDTYESYQSKIEDINKTIEEQTSFSKYQEYLQNKKRKKTQTDEETEDRKAAKLRHPYDYFYTKINDVYNKEVMDKIYRLFNITSFDDLKKMYSFCIISLIETSPNKFLPEEILENFISQLSPIFSEQEIKEFMSSSLFDIHLYHQDNSKHSKHFDELGFRSYKYDKKI